MIGYVISWVLIGTNFEVNTGITAYFSRLWLTIAIFPMIFYQMALKYLSNTRLRGDPGISV